ncbi:MAG: hypothetical protein HEQ38_19795 [Gemmatimonas sp.]|jgi:acyl-homoserine-lactone acylase|uniref:penicillin acylase family protein n=1 Tax=Gemmatimonas sp. TaxID=1962908 RepID=UPI0031C4CAB0|nr:hypothetical protein [Gemmatimonas sp.]
MTTPTLRRSISPRARSLAEWKRALATRARATSNLTYADRAGNILTIWMASIPRLPHVSGHDSLPVPARGSVDIWTRRITLDSFPQPQNPPGGYVHNENDAPRYANPRALLDTAKSRENVAPDSRGGLLFETWWRR